MHGDTAVLVNGDEDVMSLFGHFSPFPLPMQRLWELSAQLTRDSRGAVISENEEIL